MGSQMNHPLPIDSGVQGERDVNASLIGLIGFLGALIVFAIIILLQVVYYGWVSRVEARNRTVLPNEVIQVKTEQQLRLNAGGPGGPGQPGVLPIDRAMKLVLRDLGAGRSASSVGGVMQPAAAPVPGDGPPGSAPAGSGPNP